PSFDFLMEGRMQSCWLICGASLAVGAFALSTQGCSALPDTCENRGTCTNSLIEGTDSASGDDDASPPIPDAGSDSEALETDAASGEGGISTAPCDPWRAPAEDGCVIPDARGVFVSPAGSDDAGDGTQAKPFAPFAKAITAAKATGKRVYACAGTYPLALV